MDLRVNSNANLIYHSFNRPETIHEDTHSELWVNAKTGEVSTDIKTAYDWQVIHVKTDHTGIEAFKDEIGALPPVIQKIVLKSIKKCQTHIIKERAQFLLGQKGADLLLDAADLKQCIPIIFHFIEQQLSRKEPLQECEISVFYQLLFESPIKNFAISLLDDPNHPAAVLWNLRECILAFQANSETALQPIGASLESGFQFQGVNASYLLKDKQGIPRFVFKPAERESQEQRAAEGIEPGHGAKREHVSSIINQLTNNAFPIPYTAFITLGDMGKGSVQAFQPDCEALTLHRSEDWIQDLSADKVQALALFDLLFCNTDRHDGNILVRKATLDLFAIDHGGCMTAAIEDNLKLDYRSLPQMWMPYTDQAKELIQNFNPEAIRSLLNEHEIDENAVRWMEIAYALISEGIRQSEENKEAGNVEITPFDFSMFFLYFRKTLMENHNESDLKIYIEEILAFKQIIKDNKKPDGTVDRKLFYRHMQKNNERQDLKKEIFEKIIKDPYIDQPAMKKKLEDMSEEKAA